MAVDAAVALLHDVGIPGDFDVDEVFAEVVEVDALGSGVGGEQDAHGGGWAGFRLEGVDDRVAFLPREGAVQDHQRVAAVAVVREDGPQPRERVHEFREENHAFGVGRAAGLEMVAQPLQDGAGLGVFG